MDCSLHMTRLWVALVLLAASAVDAALRSHTILDQVKDPAITYVVGTHADSSKTHTHHLTLDASSNRHQDIVSFEITAYGKKHTLDLRRNAHSFPSHVTMYRGANKVKVPMEGCHYQGVVRNEPISMVSMYTCHGGLEGTITIDDIEYSIHPAGEHLPQLASKHKHKGTEAHVIYRNDEIKGLSIPSYLDVRPNASFFEYFAEPSSQHSSRFHAQSASHPVDNVIEVAVTIGYQLFFYMAAPAAYGGAGVAMADITKIFAKVVNSADLLWKLTGLKVHLLFKSLTFPSSTTSPFSALYTNKYSTLSALTNWGFSSSAPAHDAIVTFMYQPDSFWGLGTIQSDICAGGGRAFSTVGYIHYKTDSTTYANNVDAFSGLPSSVAYTGRIFAHELAHNFGCKEHTGSNGCNGVPGGHVMDGGGGTPRFTVSGGWSACCKAKLTTGVADSQSCLTSLADASEEDCGNGYYKDGTSDPDSPSQLPSSCKECKPECSACVDGGSCTRCLNGTALEGGNCVADCQPGYYFGTTDSNIPVDLALDGYVCTACPITCGSGVPTCDKYTGDNAVCGAAGADTTPPVVSSCPGSIDAKKSSGASGVVVTWIAPTGTDGVDGPITPTVTTEPAGLNSGSSFAAGTTVVTYTFTDAASNAATCVFNVTVTDDLVPPVVSNCPLSATKNADAGANGTTFTYTTPTATDNVDGPLTTAANITFVAGASGSFFAVGVHYFTFGFRDSSGNRADCPFTLTVVDNQPPTVNNCPSSTVFKVVGGSVSTAAVSFTTPTAEDSTDGTVAAVVSSTPPGLSSGGSFPVGTSTVTYTFTDSANNAATCIVTVTVEQDTSAPSVTCPASVTANTGSASSVPVTFGAPTAATDDYPNINTQSALLSTAVASHASGSSFAAGVHTVQYTVTDAAGNNGTCSFTVTVVDNAAPTVTCPDSITVNSSTFTKVVSWTTTATDNVSPQNQLTITSTHASGSTFTQGTTSVTVTAKDAAQNAAQCQFSVTVNVVDSTPPAITCPSDVSVSSGASSSTAKATWNNPVASDDITPPSALAISSSHVKSVTDFDVGVTTVSYTVQDAAGLSSTCTFNVTVSDHTPPTVSNCPSSSSIHTDAGSNKGTFTFVTPTASDNVDGVLSPDGTLTSTPGASGTALALGTHVYSFGFRDAAGNVANCTFSVTVADNQAPLVSGCPATAILKVVGPSTSTAVATYTVPTASDNVGGAVTPVVTSSPTASLTSGSNFPVGETTVQYVFTDAAGNAATCTVTVRVEQDSTPPSVTCPSAVSVNTGSAASATVSFGDPTAASDNYPTLNPQSALLATATATPASGTTFVVGSTTVTYTVTDAAGNKGNCSFLVTVQDNAAPTVTCPSNIVTTSPTYNKQVNYSVTATDNVTPQNQLIITSTHNSGSQFAQGTTTVVVTAKDAAQNSAQCQFSVTVSVVDSTPPTIQCPADVTVNTGAYGGSTVKATWSNPTVSDDITPVTGLSTSSSHVKSVFDFPIGNTTVTYTTQDAAGLTATCSFVVTVVDTRDTTAPTITCPSDKSVNITSSSTVAVSWSPTSVSDNQTPTSQLQISSTPSSGSFFGAGPTSVTVRVTDLGGLYAECSFNVIATDVMAPTISCPSNVAATTGANGAPLTVATWDNPTYDDNLGQAGVSLQTTHAPGSSFAFGTTTVTYTAEDAANNKASCTFDVTVTDGTPPSVTCPADQTKYLASTSSSVAVSWAPPATTDNVSPASAITVSVSPASGSTFALGVHTVTATATDAAGNHANCTFSVSVLADTAPTITGCPSGASTHNMDSGVNYAHVSFTPPVATDVQGTPTVSASHSPGDKFYVGNTTVTYIFSDSAGQQATCTFVIRVVDNQAPSVTCPSADVSVNSGSASSVPVDLSLVGVSVTDNAGTAAVTTTFSPASGSSFSVGAHSVMVTATDPSSNTASCNFTLNVVDTGKPVVSGCPDNITVGLDATGSAPAVSWTAPTASDNSGASPSVTVTSSVGGLGSGSPVTFAIGTHSVTYTFEDGAGNQAVCNFTVTVEDVVKCEANPCSSDSVCVPDTDGNPTEVTINGITVKQEYACYESRLRLYAGTASDGAQTFAGRSWVPDDSFQLSESNVVNALGSSADLMYRKQRTFTVASAGATVVAYQLNVDQVGSYVVRLYHAETIFTAAGQRKFDVLVNDVVSEPSLDVYTKVGANTGYVSDHKAPVTDPTKLYISLKFRSLAGAPEVNAIQVLVDPSSVQNTTTPAGPPGDCKAINLNAGGPSLCCHATTGVCTASSDASTCSNEFWVGDTDSVNFQTVGALGSDITYMSGPYWGSVATPAANTGEQQIWKYERKSNFYFGSGTPPQIEYTFDVGCAAKFTVELYLGEFLFTWAPGQRKFDILLQDSVVASQVDDYTEAGGGNKGYIKSFDVDAPLGTIKLAMRASTQQSHIMGVRIKWKGEMDSTHAALSAGTVAGGAIAVLFVLILIIAVLTKGCKKHQNHQEARAHLGASVSDLSMGAAAPPVPFNQQDSVSQMDVRTESVVGDLPAGWVRKRDPETDGIYYYDETTGQSQWDPPVLADKGFAVRRSSQQGPELELPTIDASARGAQAVYADDDADEEVQSPPSSSA